MHQFCMKGVVFHSTQSNIIKTTANATYTGIICWAISLHHLSFSVYKKL